MASPTRGLSLVGLYMTKLKLYFGIKMEFRKPKTKKNLSFNKKSFPLGSGKQVVGVFNGQFVIVHDLDSMIYLYEGGNFGKGSLSKGEPNYHARKDDIPKIMHEHEFENQAKWNDNANSTKLSRLIRKDYKLSVESVSNFLKSSFNDELQISWKSLKSISQHETSKRNSNFSVLESKTDEPEQEDELFISFVNDILESKQIRLPNPSNSDPEVIVLSTSFDLPPGDGSVRLERLYFSPEETLNLNLEEAFYLKSVLGCLRIVDFNFSEMNISDLWRKFNALDKKFTERYLTYSHYRLKGWVVRSGLKFGGDFLLYKDGPAHYHGSYLVKVLDGRKKLTWREIVAMNRLVETFNKDLVLSHVFRTKEMSNEEESFQDALENHSLQEVLVRRWFPTKDRL